jgi:hypothetical protein
LGGASSGQFPFGLDIFIRSAGVTLTEFNDVVFKLDYFERKNILVADSELISIVSQHYMTQVLKQFYVLVLGLDVIGNPMKLVLGLQKGLKIKFIALMIGLTFDSKLYNSFHFECKHINYVDRQEVDVCEEGNDVS